MNEIYVVCKTTWYSSYYTPVYVETDASEAYKMKNELNKLYQRLIALRDDSIIGAWIALVIKMKLNNCIYQELKDIDKIHDKYPMVLLTNLEDQFWIFNIENERLAKERHSYYMEYSKVYNSNLFRLDFNEEVRRAKEQIKAIEDSRYDCKAKCI